jgi:hypothetical protein
MPQNLIEFHCLDSINGVPIANVLQPIPAAAGVPPRVKRLPPEMLIEDNFMLSTVKECPPFIDAMTSGYLIPIIADVQFTMNPDGLDYKSELPIIEQHDIRQLAGTDMQRLVVLKILNPWIVRTPPGYSCLFTNPLNRFDIPFQALNGVVETDSFYHEVHFPTICLLGPGQSFHLKKGTPIAQVIPFKRDDWTSQIGKADMQQRLEWEAAGVREGRYRNVNWQRKKYD